MFSPMMRLVADDVIAVAVAVAGPMAVAPFHCRYLCYVSDRYIPTTSTLRVREDDLELVRSTSSNDLGDPLSFAWLGACVEDRVRNMFSVVRSSPEARHCLMM